jgi:hypothetical protein
VVRRGQLSYGRQLSTVPWLPASHRNTDIHGSPARKSILEQFLPVHYNCINDCLNVYIVKSRLQLLYANNTTRGALQAAATKKKNRAAGTALPLQTPKCARCVQNACIVTPSCWVGGRWWCGWLLGAGFLCVWTCVRTHVCSHRSLDLLLTKGHPPRLRRAGSRTAKGRHGSHRV